MWRLSKLTIKLFLKYFYRISTGKLRKTSTIIRNVRSSTGFLYYNAYHVNIELLILDSIRLFQDHPEFASGIKVTDLVRLVKQGPYGVGDLESQVKMALKELQLSGFVRVEGNGYRTVGPFSRLVMAKSKRQFIKIWEKLSHVQNPTRQRATPVIWHLPKKDTVQLSADSSVAEENSAQVMSAAQENGAAPAQSYDEQSFTDQTQYGGEDAYMDQEGCIAQQQQQQCEAQVGYGVQEQCVGQTDWNEDSCAAPAAYYGGQADMSSAAQTLYGVEESFVSQGPCEYFAHTSCSVHTTYLAHPPCAAHESYAAPASFDSNESFQS